LDIGDQEIGSQLDHLTGDIQCPRCRTKMTRLVDIDQYCIWYEVCPKCQGVWLDAGEFTQLRTTSNLRAFSDTSVKCFAKVVIRVTGRAGCHLTRT
jgi:Zn-finger nucleic acid-binding protein